MANKKYIRSAFSVRVPRGRTFRILQCGCIFNSYVSCNSLVVSIYTISRGSKHVKRESNLFVQSIWRLSRSSN
jgi:hypothetical protein